MMIENDYENWEWELRMRIEKDSCETRIENVHWEKELRMRIERETLERKFKVRIETVIIEWELRLRMIKKQLSTMSYVKKKLSGVIDTLE